MNDDLLLASEITSAYMPYCNYYVSTVDIAELILMSGINEEYKVRVYDHNESSLYKLIDDLTLACRSKSIERRRKETKTMFRKKMNNSMF